MILGLLLLRFFYISGITLIILGIFLLYAQSIPYTAYIISKNIELPPLSKNALKISDAIVVLGGGLSSNEFEYESGVMVNRSTMVRLNYTAYLAKQYPNKLIVTSGGYTGKFREADIMRDVLIKSFGVKNPVIVENNSRNTDENARFVANILLPKDIHNIIVVTQAYHMRRALMLFEKYGMKPIPASTDYYISEYAATPSLSIIPTAGAMDQVSIIYHEILGYSLYK
jgi:uncharacterized SAM-binding protein YcdF (DUF218 family)